MVLIKKGKMSIELLDAMNLRVDKALSLEIGMSAESIASVTVSYALSKDELRAAMGIICGEVDGGEGSNAK